MKKYIICYGSYFLPLASSDQMKEVEEPVASGSVSGKEAQILLPKDVVPIRIILLHFTSNPLWRIL